MEHDNVCTVHGERIASVEAKIDKVIDEVTDLKNRLTAEEKTNLTNWTKINTTRWIALGFLSFIVTLTTFINQAIVWLKH